MHVYVIPRLHKGKIAPQPMKSETVKRKSFVAILETNSAPTVHYCSVCEKRKILERVCTTKAWIYDTAVKIVCTMHMLEHVCVCLFAKYCNELPNIAVRVVGVCVCGIQRSQPVRSTSRKLPQALSLRVTHEQVEDVF